MEEQPRKELVPIEAAGGYVVRRSELGTEVLMIFRRGRWDLPKGKPDPGETPPVCALREVEEETGAAGLRIWRGVGMTLHRYIENGEDIVKTTWWFLMTTESSRFQPQLDEQIDKVEWVEWERAKQIVGYDNLRRHMTMIDATITSFGVDDD